MGDSVKQSGHEEKTQGAEACSSLEPAATAAVDGALEKSINEEGEEQPTMSFKDLSDMVDAEEDLMTAVFAGSDERNCSYPRGYVKRQALFACRDCSRKENKASSSTLSYTNEKQLFPEPAGVCLACALACHADHDLIELYTKRNFRCDCGNSRLTEVPCRLFPKKEADNPLNTYNHNFAGLYCTCEKPYPVDPNDSEAEKIADEEMVQCIVCEDWYHACHLAMSPEDVPLLEKDDEEYELVCPSCCSKHLFLIDYYLHFKKLNAGSKKSQEQVSTVEEPCCTLKKFAETSSSSEMDSTKASSNEKVLLFPPNWRSQLCKCESCKDMYSQQDIAFITDLTDTLAAYEAAGRDRTANAGGVSMSDRLVSATLSNIRDRVVQNEIAHGYAEFKAQLTEFIHDVGARKRVITEEDVNEFFDKLSEKKRKKVDNCGGAGSSGSNSRSDGGNDDTEGSSGIGTPPATCHGNCGVIKKMSAEPFGDGMSRRVTHDPPSYDLNSAKFDVQAYMDKIVREQSLSGIVQLESTMTREMRQMDSDMQTLVYENYNKFITATDTIRQMKSDFHRMEVEMAKLSENMTEITSSSESISNRLSDNRTKMAKWMGVHNCLKKLDFLFHLPETLERCIQYGQYGEAVDYYLGVKRVLDNFSDKPSFQSIRVDCESVIEKLKAALKAESFRYDSGAGMPGSNKRRAENMELLLRLGESAEKLCEEFLANASVRIAKDLDQLDEEVNKIKALEAKRQMSIGSGTGSETSSGSNRRTRTSVSSNDALPGDVLSFVDFESNNFLGSLSLIINAYNAMFLSRDTDNRLSGVDAENSMQLYTLAMKKLVRFVNLTMHRYFNVVEERFRLEPQAADTGNLVRALDRFHRRLQAMTQLLNDIDFSQTAMEVIAKIARQECQRRLSAAQAHFYGCLSAVKQRVSDPAASSSVPDAGPSSAMASLLSTGRSASSSITGATASTGSAGSSTATLMVQMLEFLNTTVVNHLKAALINLQAFLATDITFAVKPYFQSTFCAQDVREGFLVAYFRSVADTCESFATHHQLPGNINYPTSSSIDRTLTPSSSSSHQQPPPASFFLILSRFCIQMEQSTIGYLLTLADEQFLISQYAVQSSGSGNFHLPAPTLTGRTHLCAEQRRAAGRLLQQYVSVAGSSLSQMVRKSIEARDWLSSTEPRSVRTVMKRIVEEITVADQQVGQMFEEGQRREDSESSRRGFSGGTFGASASFRGSQLPWPRSSFGALHHSSPHAHLATTKHSVSISGSTNALDTPNLITRLFSEKISIFGPVEFTQVSIMTGIVKIVLKALLEFVRLKTFDKYGYQQIQVDCYYLHQYLTRFVSDEKIVQQMLDDVLNSVTFRCLDAVPMEWSVVARICEV